MMSVVSTLLRWGAAALILMAALPALQAAAQSADEQVRVAVRGDSAYVYHTERVPLGAGFHVERSVGGGAFERLTDEPVVPVANPALLPRLLGERYEAIREDIGAEAPDEVFFRLRADRTMNLFLSMAYADVARAMGRLFVDPEAPVGEEVTYRVVFVDDLNRPTGETLEQEVAPLEAIDAPAPSAVELSNEGDQVRIDWEYPTSDPSGAGDQVARFEVLRIDPATGERDVVSGEATLLRNEAQQDFFYLFEAEEMGRAYEYVVAAVQMTGRRIESEPVEYVVEDDRPPAVVEGLEVYFEESERVELSWRISPEPDVTGYRVYRAQSLTDEFEALNEEPLDALEPVFVDTTVIGREAYYYRVAAIDEEGRESEMSNPVMARVEDNTPPPAPVSAEVEVREDGAVDVRWETGAPAPADLETYEVLYRRLDTSSEHAWVRANPGTVQADSLRATGIEERGFAEGATYRFGVSAVDRSLNRIDTAIVEVTIPHLTPPEPPEVVEALNEGGTRVLLRWNRSASAAVTDYVVYRRDEAAGAQDSVVARTTRPNQFQVRDREVDSGREYVYSVAAVDSVGNEGPRSEPTAITMRSYDPPPAVRNVQAVAREEGVTLTWEPTTGEVSGYRIYRSDLPTGIYEPVTDELEPATEFTDGTGEADVYYRIYAVDSAGNTSDPSRPARAREPRE